MWKTEGNSTPPTDIRMTEYTSTTTYCTQRSIFIFRLLHYHFRNLRHFTSLF